MRKPLLMDPANVQRRQTPSKKAASAGGVAGSHRETIATRLIRQSHLDNLAMPADWSKERLDRLCLLWDVDIEVIAAMLNCRVGDLNTQSIVSRRHREIKFIPDGGIGNHGQRRMSGTVALMLTMLERQAHERKGMPCSAVPIGSSAGAKPFRPVPNSRFRSAAKREFIALKAAEAQKRRELGLPPLGDLGALARKQRKAQKLFGVKSWTGDCAA